MNASRDVLIRIWVERPQPLVGTAAVEDAEPLAFHGWLELLMVLSELVVRDGRTSDDR